MRRFATAVGVSPASYRRVVRLRRLLRAPDDGASWAGRAIELGYADRAHMIRGFRAMTGTTPTRTEA